MRYALRQEGRISLIAETAPESAAIIFIMERLKNESTTQLKVEVNTYGYGSEMELALDLVPVEKT